LFDGCLLYYVVIDIALLPMPVVSRNVIYEDRQDVKQVLSYVLQQDTKTGPLTHMLPLKRGPAIYIDCLLDLFIRCAFIIKCVCLLSLYLPWQIQKQIYFIINIVNKFDSLNSVANVFFLTIGCILIEYSSFLFSI